MLTLIAILLVIIGWKQIITFVATVVSTCFVVFVMAPVLFVVWMVTTLSEAIFGKSKE